MGRHEILWSPHFDGSEFCEPPIQLILWSPHKRHYFFISSILKGRYTSHTHVCHKYLRHTCGINKYAADIWLGHTEYATIICSNHKYAMYVAYTSMTRRSMTRVSSLENGRNEKIMPCVRVRKNNTFICAVFFALSLFSSQSITHLADLAFVNLILP